MKNKWSKEAQNRNQNQESAQGINPQIDLTFSHFVVSNRPFFHPLTLFVSLVYLFYLRRTRTPQSTVQSIECLQAAPSTNYGHFGLNQRLRLLVLFSYAPVKSCKCVLSIDSQRFTSVQFTRSASIREKFKRSNDTISK